MLGRRISLQALSEYLRDPGGDYLEGHAVRELILHHTWSPTTSQYRGLSTWQSIRNYHMRERGWRDIGYHLGVGPREEVWLLRPVTMTGGHCTGHNNKSLGIVMVGNFDKGHDDPNLCLPTALRVLAVCCQVLDLDPSRIYFHRDFASKSCPGSAIDREQVRKGVREAMNETPSYPPAGTPIKIVMQYGDSSEVIGEGLFDGQNTYVPVRLLEKATDWAAAHSPERPGYQLTVTDHLRDQRKVYITVVPLVPPDSSA